MSTRTLEQASGLAALKVAHTAQIEALTAPGLSDEERANRYADAAGFSPEEREFALRDLRAGNAPAKAVWWRGDAPLSLFANLPGCNCPVWENYHGRAAYPGIPSYIPDDWRPTEAELLPFARVQQAARFPEVGG